MFKSKVVNNTIMLYLMSFARLIFPLLTLPYLTRVLSTDIYGFVSYVKSCMTYMQLIVDFGFILSAVKDIVNANGDKDKIGTVIGNTIVSKLLLVVVAGIVMLVMCVTIDILQLNILYVVLSFIAVACTTFLLDFFFRGIEKMQYITVIFLISKGVSVLLTFVLVKGDSTVIWIPVLDIVTNLISVVISYGYIIKEGYRVHFGGIKQCLASIADSFVYFLSNVSTTAFSALNTLLVGIYMKDLTQVAYWSLCLNVISAIQGLYAPVTNSIYPHMIREKNLGFIHKVMKLFMPIIVVGCAFVFVVAKPALVILGGEQYTDAYVLLRWMIPILFFSFPVQVYGWPTLGAVGKTKEVTASTIIAAAAQIAGLLVLGLTNHFTVINLAILRFSTEALMMYIRMFFVYKNKNEFSLQ